jgi:DNA-binding NtrC family response regulator
MALPTLSEYLARATSGGVIEVFGSRALLLRADTFQRLRQELAAQLGPGPARALLERFGQDHGRAMAVQVRKALPDYWRSEALGNVPPLLGHSELVDARRIRTPGGPPAYEFRWNNSLEAAEPRLDRPAGEGACWALCGFAAGFVGEMEGRFYRFVEEECQASGAPHCRMLGHAAVEPGDAPTALGPAALALATRAEVLIAESPAMREAVARARLAARSTATLLVTGESGTGKELVARLVHRESPRAAGPFVALNCGAISETLLESELFGHARGAFTGADRDTPGVFEAAQGGSLLLDEVGEMPASMQVKLLRALEERRVRRVGEVRERAFDVRIMCATHRRLEEEVAAGRFREDLLYRLRVVEVEVPPLRARPEDVLPLARFFLQRSAQAAGLPLPALGPAAEAALVRHPWPGNVRELRNVAERAVVLCRGATVDVGDLPREVRGDAGPFPPTRLLNLEQLERQSIAEALRAFGGDKRRAAAALGISLATLYRKLHLYAGEPGPEEPSR